MFPESEKQFSIQRKEIPVSPEKREEAIQYAEEIKRIREKEILTEEDLVRVEELAEKLKRIYSPEIYFESEKAKERLRELEKTPLWDKRRKQWRKYINENQEPLSLDRYSDSQLLGVLAEAVTGKLKEAKERLEELKETLLWDKEREQWNWSMNENQEPQDLDCSINIQLLGVLAEAVTGNLEEAKERLEELKETPLWDEEREQWNWYMDKNQNLKNSIRTSDAQLLGVLAEAVTGKLKEAKEKLKKLKKTPLWDKKRKQWNWHMGKAQELGSSSRYSYSQLLGVLAEAITGNLEGAKERLKKLKETPLWDKEREQWNWYMNKDQKLIDSSRPSDVQLLGVLTEAFYEKEEEFVERLIKKK